MATNNKKFRIQNGANIQGELSFDNVTVIDSDGLVAAASVQPAVESIVNTTYVNALNVTAFDALTAQSVTDISSFTTTDITEGANLYFTAQRARDAIQAGTGVSYDPVSGAVSTALTGGEGISVSGDEISFDGSSISQDIVPSVDNTYSLGSPDKVWRDVYIGPGSLYINGTKILEDNSGTITMYADPGQVLAFGTSGGGNIDFNAGEATIDFKSDMVMLPGKTISTSGGNPTAFGGDIDLVGNCIFNVAVPETDGEAANKGYVDALVANPHVGDKEFGGSVTVQGDLTVQGTTTTVNSQTLSIADNLVDLNSDVVSGTPTENAGIRVMRGDELPAQLRWNETNDHWEVYNGTSWTKIALSTDDLAEGSNLYFTQPRVEAIVNPIVTRIDQDIADEAQARADADSAETAARVLADTNLQNQIDGLQSSVNALPIESGDSDTLAAAKSYADAQDAVTLQSAKDYADTHKATVEAGYSAGDSALNDALVSGDAATLQSAKDYTDGREVVLSAVDSAQGVLISDNAQAILTEKSRAEGVESTLRSDLTSETQSRQLADSALQSNIDVVSGRVDAIIGTSPETLDTLQEIVTAFEGADGNLQTVITDNSSRLSVLESANTTRQQEIVSGDSDTLAAAKAHADAGDSVLDAKIDVEINARIAGDSALNAALTQEINDRIAGDDALQTQINNVQTEYSAGDSALNDALTQEISDRIAGDNALSSRLDSDRQERVVVDSDHNSRLSVLESDMIVSKSNDSDHRVDIDANALAISNEVTDRIAADGVLQDNIDTVSGRVDAILNGAGESLDTIVEIVSAFENADSDIQSLITNNASGLTAEESARIAADGVLQGNIDDEAVARANADTALQNQINTIDDTVRALPIESGDSDTLAAAKAYADAQDAVTLASAKSYADDHKATVEAGYSAGDSALNVALVAGDSATLQSAKDYTDSREVVLDAKDASQDVAIQANADAIAQEVLDRVAGDNQLQSAIDSLTGDLAQARTDFGTGDSALNDAIEAVDARVDAILDGSTVDLDSLKEIVDAFQGADSDLQNVMSSNSSRLSAAEADIDSLELAMTQRIAEIGNINTDIGDVNARVDQEVLDRVAGDNQLQSQIDSLSNDVQALPIVSGDSDTLASAKAFAIAEDNKVKSTVSLLDGRVGNIEINHPILISDGDSATLASANSYTDGKFDESKNYADGIVNPITGIEIPGLKDKDSDQDVRLAALEAADVTLSGRLDSDRLEWIGADSALDVRVTTLENEMDTVEGRLDSDRLLVIGLDSDLRKLIADEATARVSADNGLQTQIDNLLSNTDSAALNSLAEIVAEFQQVDSGLTGLINSNAADISALQGDVLALEGINAGSRLSTAEGTLINHGGRITTLESSMAQAQQDIIDLPGQIKGDLVGGLCITATQEADGTVEIAIDEAEVRSTLVTYDADNLGGNDPSHYRINVYRVDGTLVN